MSDKRFALGVDYGTGSVRSVIFDLTDGSEVASNVYEYPHGEDGVIASDADPLIARQHPADYIEGLFQTISRAVADARRNGFDPSLLAGIGVDATSSTPIPVDKKGNPLALNPKYDANLSAMAWLWKDHSSWREADKINLYGRPLHLLDRCGGTASSEWYWAKILHCKKESPEVFAAAFSWVELADYIPGVLTGNLGPETMARGICSAGHKAIYDERWEGLPPTDFLAALDPDLLPLRRRFAKAHSSDKIAGYLTESNAAKVGLFPGVPVAVGAIDAHLGAVGAGVRPGRMVKIIGTSTCDMLVHPLREPLSDIPGVCGIVPGSILPGMYGLEAGQTAVGDIFNWFVKNMTPEKFFRSGDPHAALSAEAANLRPGQSGLLGLDWNNGNRSTLDDPLLTGLTLGTTLHTTAPEMYRALIEATAFGALTIVNRYSEYGVPVNEVVTCGGIAEKNPLLMQIYADVLNRPMKIARSSQACALGAAIFGAVAGGAFPDVLSAQDAMTGVQEETYSPKPENVAVYAELYKLYLRLYNAYGGVKQTETVADVMKTLIKIRNEASAAGQN